MCITNIPWQQKTHHLFIIIKATHTWNQERWPFWEAYFLCINMVIEVKIAQYRCLYGFLLFDSNRGNQCLLFWTHIYSWTILNNLCFVPLQIYIFYSKTGMVLLSLFCEKRYMCYIGFLALCNKINEK